MCALSFLFNTNFQNTNKIMIKANELRIGNLFQGEKFSIARYGIHSDGITSITGFGLYLLSENDNALDLTPIPLTEEWLKKLGFLYYEECDLYILEGVEIAGYLKESMSIYIFGSVDSINVQYVHQLQNLFFSIVGEELVFSTEPITSHY